MQMVIVAAIVVLAWEPVQFSAAPSQSAGTKELKVARALVHDAGLKKQDRPFVFLVLLDTPAECRDLQNKTLTPKATYFIVDIEKPIAAGEKENPPVQVVGPGLGMTFFGGPTGKITITDVKERSVRVTAALKHQAFWLNGEFEAEVCEPSTAPSEEAQARRLTIRRQPNHR